MTTADDGWMRTKGQAVGLRIIGWLEVGWASLFALAALSPRPGTGASVSTSHSSLMILAALIQVPGIIVAFRAARAGCRVEDDVLRIRGAFTERTIPWSDIHGFSLGYARLSPFVCRVHLHDGTIVPIMAIRSSSIKPDNPRTIDMIARLLDEMGRRRPSGIVEA